MSPLRTSLVTRRHAYTSTDLPWRMDVDRTVSHVAPDGRRFGWRLFHYLSGGGIRAFGCPSGRALRARRQARALWTLAALAALWILFWFV